MSTTKVPPDGGWGWAIVLAFAINGLSTIPIIQGFGLVFKDTFPLLGFNATDATIIINTNLAFGMILGLVNGPLLGHFGYRKVAIAGSIIYTIGVTLTAFATSFSIILFSYGILASLGMGLTMSGFSFALNSYFTTKRSRAMGMAQTINGLGPIFMPHVTSLLITVYGFQGTILIFGALSLHSLIGAFLLHPIKWHLKEVPNPTKNTIEESAEKLLNTNTGEHNGNAENENSPKNSTLDLSRPQRKRKTTISSIDHDIEVGSIYGFETPLPRQLSETLKTPSWDKNIDMIHRNGNIGTSKTSLKKQKLVERPWFSSVKSINLGSSMKIFEEEHSDDLKRNGNLNFASEKILTGQYIMERNSVSQKDVTETAINMDIDKDKCKKGSTVVRILKSIVDFYDLRLLRDPIYVNIMLGMAIAIFAEINFSLLTPFILADMGLKNTKIAYAMSVVASVDLIFRSLAPFLGEWLRQPPREMYLVGLFLLMISRTFLIFAEGFTSILFIAVALGAAKGIRSVYMPLVVPSYVPINRLPYASGIQMIINGIVLMGAGPILGLIRDAAGSYRPCIAMMNIVTACTIILWLIEMFIVRRRNLLK